MNRRAFDTRRFLPEYVLRTPSGLRAKSRFLIWLPGVL
jgi:hypothetical protein